MFQGFFMRESRDVRGPIRCLVRIPLACPAIGVVAGVIGDLAEWPGVGHFQFHVNEIVNGQEAKWSVRNATLLRDVRYLYVDGIAVTDASLQHVREFPRLSTLWLSGTGVTVEGLRRERPTLTVHGP